MGVRKMKLFLFTVFVGSEAFLRCPRVRPVDCESCNTLNFKCKQQLNVRKECAQHCRLEEMKCPVDLVPNTCGDCEKISLTCQRRMGTRQQCRDLCDPPIMCPMSIPGSCQDCRALSVPCRQPHKAQCHAFCLNKTSSI